MSDNGNEEGKNGEEYFDEFSPENDNLDLDDNKSPDEANNNNPEDELFGNNQLEEDDEEEQPPEEDNVQKDDGEGEEGLEDQEEMGPDDGEAEDEGEENIPQSEEKKPEEGNKGGFIDLIKNAVGSVINRTEEPKNEEPKVEEEQEVPNDDEPIPGDEEEEVPNDDGEIIDEEPNQEIPVEQKPKEEPKPVQPEIQKPIPIFRDPTKKEETKPPEQPKIPEQPKVPEQPKKPEQPQNLPKDFNYNPYQPYQNKREILPGKRPVPPAQKPVTEPFLHKRDKYPSYKPNVRKSNQPKSDVKDKKIITSSDELPGRVHHVFGGVDETGLVNNHNDPYDNRDNIKFYVSEPDNKTNKKGFFAGPKYNYNRPKPQSRPKPQQRPMPRPKARIIIPEVRSRPEPPERQRPYHNCPNCGYDLSNRPRQRPSQNRESNRPKAYAGFVNQVKDNYYRRHPDFKPQTQPQPQPNEYRRPMRYQPNEEIPRKRYNMGSYDNNRRGRPDYDWRDNNKDNRYHTTTMVNEPDSDNYQYKETFGSSLEPRKKKKRTPYVYGDYNGRALHHY